MVFTSATPLAGFVATFVALVSLLPSTASAATITYCSTQNTGANSPNYSSTFQSNGYCSNKCSAAYAYAVINYKDCWCSNYAPQEQDSTSSCDGSCPGYPEEICGSNSGDRFVYIAMGNKPSGTQGTDKPTSPSVNPSSGTPSPVSTAERQRGTQTIIRTVTAPAPAALSTSTSTSTPTPGPSSSPPPPPSPTPSSATTLATSASSVASMTSARLITVGGQIVTETVIIANPSSAPTQDAQNPPKSSTNVAAIAGGVIGGVFGLIAIVGGAFFFLWRRRRQQRDDEDDSGVHRNVSTMSKAGLLRTEKSMKFPSPIATNVSNRNSRNMMHDADSVSPISVSDRRNSRPIIFDQRLNPSAIMTFDNTSTGSVISMDDSRDYGRTLNVRNPDPDPESR